MVATVQVKPKKIRINERKPRRHLQLLKTEGVKNQYALKVRNKYEQLKDECTGEQTAEQKWNNLEKAFKEGNNLIPERERRARKP